MQLGSRSRVGSGYVNLNALGFGIQTCLFVMKLVLILLGAKLSPHYEEKY